MSTAKAKREEEFQPRVGPYDPDNFRAWHERHGKAPFSKEFNRILARRMRDPLVDQDSRVVAWVVLHTSGNDSDWCVDGHGCILTQADSARDTGLARQRVSESLVRLEARGEVWLAKDGTGRIYQLDGRTNGEPLSGTSGQNERKLFKTLEANWRQKHPELCTLREEAERRIDEIMTRAREECRDDRETVKAIDLQMLTDLQRQLKSEGDAEAEEVESVSETVGQNVRDAADNSSETVRTKERPIIIEKTERENNSTSSSSLRSLPLTEEEAPSVSTTTNAPVFDPTAPLNKTLFHQELLKTFADADKPAPTKKQSDQAFVQVQTEARGFYVQDLRSRIQTIHHPGVLATDAVAFAQSWPHRKLKMLAEWEQRKTFAERRQTWEASQHEEDIREAERTLAYPDATEEEKELARFVKGERRRVAGGRP